MNCLFEKHQKPRFIFLKAEQPFRENEGNEGEIFSAVRTSLQNALNPNQKPIFNPSTRLIQMINDSEGGGLVNSVEFEALLEYGMENGGLSSDTILLAFKTARKNGVLMHQRIELLINKYSKKIPELKQFDFNRG